MNNQHPILAVCLNPTLQITIRFTEVLEGEVNRAYAHRLDASGKGMNLARVVRQLGGDVRLLSHLGDQRKEEFLQMAKEDGVPILWTDSKSPIRTCITVLADKGNSTTELVLESERVGAHTEATIRELFSKELASHPVVVFSGTRTPGYSDNLYPKMVQQAKEAGCYVILDYRGRDLVESIPHSPDVIKPNLTEFWHTFFPNETPLAEGDDNNHLKELVKEKIIQLYEKFSISTIITRGLHPLWAYHDGAFIEREVKNVRAINTIGCGDAFTAGFAFAVAKEESFEIALETGLDAASRNAQVFRPGSLFD